MAKDKQKSLDLIRQLILDNKVCPELAKNATQLVFGAGNTNASIMLIGEAPGKKEDEQGLPFVGASGKFLNEMLESINLKRSDVYITNIVKYRPPNNRDPLPEEKQAFLPYLQAQIEVIQPKLIIPLGRHSMNCFLPDLQISKVHGQPFRKKVRIHRLQTSQGTASVDGLSLTSRDEQVGTTRVFVPLYHPASALYNGGMRQTLLDDFAKIPLILKKIENHQ
jgi:DNA polymerase